MQLPMGLHPSAGLLTVSQLTQLIRGALDSHLAQVWVVGEISGLRVPSSGHFYFALKDSRCQVAAVMFRSAHRSLRFKPADGMEVILCGRVGLYDVRGDLQLYVEEMEPRGVGSAQLALQQLKERLAAEGLFSDERKRALPPLPRAIAIITALNGAAIHDMLVVLAQRMPMVRVIIRPVRVQGAEAPPDIVAALHDVCGREDVDLIIVGRGGGSIEDLGAFNDERVARAIAAASVPVISAVGHETDITIADLVADRRAPTPTAAANLAVPDRRDLLRAIDDAAEALTAAVVRLVRQRRDALQATARRLRDPRRDLRTTSSRLQELRHRLARASAAQVLQTRQRLTALADRLQALNPLAVLDRGYSLTTHLVTRTIVRDAAALQPGDDLEIRLASGRAVVRVLTTHRS